MRFFEDAHQFFFCVSFYFFCDSLMNLEMSVFL